MLQLLNGSSGMDWILMNFKGRESKNNSYLVFSCLSGLLKVGVDGEAS